MVLQSKTCGSATRINKQFPIDRLDLPGYGEMTYTKQLSCPRPDGIVPFSMKGIWQDGKRSHLFIGHFTTRKVVIGVELALHCQACLGRGRSDQLQDHCVAHERLAAPVLTDPGKEAMLNLVPFTRSRWQVADGDRQARSSASCCSSHFHKRTREPLLPPPSALMSSRFASGYWNCPTSLHQRRMLSTARWPYHGPSPH